MNSAELTDMASAFDFGLDPLASAAASASPGGGGFFFDAAASASAAAQSLRRLCRIVRAADIAAPPGAPEPTLTLDALVASTSLGISDAPAAVSIVMPPDNGNDGDGTARAAGNGDESGASTIIEVQVTGRPRQRRLVTKRRKKESARDAPTAAETFVDVRIVPLSASAVVSLTADTQVGAGVPPVESCEAVLRVIPMVAIDRGAMAPTDDLTDYF
jgi:hypothetical protein